MSEVLAVGIPLPPALLSSRGLRQRVRDEVAVLQVEPSDVAALARTAPLVLVRTGSGTVEVLGDEGLLEQLDAGARLFVAGWRSGGQDKPARIGEGLSWDADGFSPP